MAAHEVTWAVSQLGSCRLEDRLARCPQNDDHLRRRTMCEKGGEGGCRTNLVAWAC